MKLPTRSGNDGTKILVAEDSRTQAQQLKHLLEEHGYNVAVAASGKEALVTLATYVPAVIVSDIVMPEVDGYTLCKAVKSQEKLRDIPVILLTSLSSPEDVIKGLHCGADNFIRKPYEGDYLLSRIEYVLANRALRKRDTLQMGVEIYLGGEKYFITAERQQMLDLLVSTYEDAIRINAALEEREQELSQSLQMLRGLHRMAETLNACRSVQEVLEGAVERALELPGIEAAWIALREGEASFRLGAARGLPPALKAPGVLEGDCQCRRKLLAGELDRVTNILECERLQKAKGDTRGLRYHASVPLWNGNRVIGVMNVAGSNHGLFRDEELKMLYGVGSQLAVATERGHLLGDLERKVEERTAALTAEIAERERAERALRQSEARYREMFEKATYGIAQVREDGTLIDANPALVQMLGCRSKEELFQLSMTRDVFADPNVGAALVEQAKKVERMKDVEVEWKRKDGVRILVKTDGRTVRDERDQVQCFEIIAEDITERRFLEKQNRQLQKFEAIGQLAGGIAHDFNNVIGVILGWADMGLEENPADNPAHGRFQKIRNQATRAAALTRQLLAFARRQILEPRNISLNETVAEVLSLLEKVIGAHIQVKRVLAPHLAVVCADPAQVEQVLMNLCLNARDAMPKGGQLVIETQNAKFDEEYCRLHTYARPGHYAQLSVSDTGVGMDAATMEHIFEPFFTTKETGKGTGLGLATAYGIVKQHGGFLHAYSEPGQGSTFRVYLPVGSGAAEAQGDRDAEPVRGGTETILVAEDHEGGREVAQEILEKLGYTVLLTANGREAVELFEANRERVALVVLDVIMPELGGPEAYARMSARKLDLPALFVTGYSRELALNESLLNKGNEILQKPYSPAQLGRKVRGILDRTLKGGHPRHV